jgi:hypothetical protein
MAMIPDWTFFYFNGGRAWNPGTESEFAAAAVHAQATVQALRWCREQRLWFVWERDCPTELQDENGTWREYPAMFCALRQQGWHEHLDCPCDNIMESLSGIVESEDRTERRNYRRIVEGELAMQAWKKANE